MFVRAFMLTMFAGSQTVKAQNSLTSDEEAWSYAVSIGTAAAIREYLRNFPTGDHIEDAVRFLLDSGALTSTGTLPQLQAAGGNGNTGGSRSLY